MLKSKIHQACVTDVNTSCEGGITIDERLMREADILPYERVEVLNMDNGTRFETYAVEGEKGEVCLSGLAAKDTERGDRVLILSYRHVEDGRTRSSRPGIVHVDEKNNIVETRQAFKVLTLLEAE
ncbi:MAG: aspartate 1-decarboxylase [Dehalococcoidales bacterium]|nr:aspartate 1-decarboxylase [Dehalococcoidales bacterium]